MGVNVGHDDDRCRWQLTCPRTDNDLLILIPSSRPCGQGARVRGGGVNLGFGIRAGVSAVSLWVGVGRVGVQVIFAGVEWWVAQPYLLGLGWEGWRVGVRR